MTDSWMVIAQRSPNLLFIYEKSISSIGWELFQVIPALENETWAGSFAHSLSLNFQFLVVGSHGARDGDGLSQIFKYSGGLFELLHSQPGFPGQGAGCGFSVAFSGNEGLESRAFVGCPFHDAGQAFILEPNGSGLWEITNIFSGVENGSSFGYSIAACINCADFTDRRKFFVGAPDQSSPSFGEKVGDVYAYEFDNPSSTWSQQSSAGFGDPYFYYLYPEEFSRYGELIFSNNYGNLVLVGAPLYGTFEEGTIFIHQGADYRMEEYAFRKFPAQPPNTSIGRTFALDKEQTSEVFLVVGVPSQGLVELAIVSRSSSTVEMIQSVPHPLLPFNLRPAADYGSAVAIGHDYVAVGAPSSGIIYVYTRTCPSGLVNYGKIDYCLESCNEGFVTFSSGLGSCEPCPGLRLDAVTCLPCAIDEYVPGWPAPLAPCQLCENTVNGTCQCLPGFFYNTSLGAPSYHGSCIPCSGSVSADGETCSPCTANWVPDGAGGCVECYGQTVGYECQPCLAGLFSPSPGNCLPCDEEIGVVVTDPVTGLQNCELSRDNGNANVGDGDGGAALSLGAIAGIVVGSVGGMALLVCFCFLFLLCFLLIIVMAIVFVIVVVALVVLFLGALLLALASAVAVNSYGRWRRRRLRNDLEMLEAYAGEEVDDGLQREFRELLFEDLSFDRKIGQGAFGQVFAGRWRETTIVAIKELNLRNNEDARREFVHEANVMTRVGMHPNVVHFIGAVTTEDRFYMVSELATHGSMLDVIRQACGGLTFEEKVSLLQGAAAGVCHLHNEGIVHRDIAARNFLIGKGHAVLVCDFGLSRILDDAGGLKEGVEPGSNTKVQTTTSNMGPVRWMAPESLTKREYSFKSDVYMFGCLILEVESGSAPFDQLGVAEVYEAVAIRGQRPPIPPTMIYSLSRIMIDCWSHDPEHRHTMDNIHEELMKL